MLSKIDRTCTVVMQQNTKEQNLSTLNNLCSLECFAHVSASLKEMLTCQVVGKVFEERDAVRIAF